MPKTLSSEFTYKTPSQTSQQPADLTTKDLKQYTQLFSLDNSKCHLASDEFLYQALKPTQYTRIIYLHDGESFEWVDQLCDSVLQKVLVVVAANARCELHEAVVFKNSLRTVDIHICAGGQLVHYQKSQFQCSAKSFDHLHVNVGPTARYQQVFAWIGEQHTLYRRALQVTLSGEGSQVALQGGIVAKALSYIQDYVSIYHNAENTRSDHTVKSIIEKEGKVDVYSEVNVSKEALNTTSRQHINHLMLDENAEAFSKPSLNIHVDEVDSIHGAVSGMIDEQLLFYMQSRGIDKELATKLYIKGFIQTCFEQVAQHKQLSRYLESHVKQISNL
ncbi:MAG: SufD family Fe-S cluster assembly protein [Pseudomonadota bacterium]|nr:SufD family Fe-S cluster assembly protein [Pseudomonadota bacterium]